MIRILVISLVVANLLLLGFQCSKPPVQPETRASQSVEKDTGIPTIHLFSEMMQDQDLMTGNRQCFSLGPFHTIEDRDQTRMRLLEVSTYISERQTEALVEKGYWVFLPPYASLLEANEELISLQALGLQDIGIIYDGEWKNAISLGYFLRQEYALSRKEGLEDKGYAPRMRVQRQAEPRYWLDYEQDPGSGLIALDMQNRPNDFMQRSLPCPEKEIVEVTGAEPEEPVQVMEQLQANEDDKQPASGQGDDAGAGESIENLLQEEGESLPGQAVEAEAEDVIETGSDDVIETAPENTVGTGPQDAAGIEAEGVNETGSESGIKSAPEETSETRAGEG